VLGTISYFHLEDLFKTILMPNTMIGIMHHMVHSEDISKNVSVLETGSAKL